jgi:hypothetical protein
MASLLIKSEFSIFYFKMLVETLPFQNAKFHYPAMYRSREKRFLSIPLREKSYKTLLF